MTLLARCLSISPSLDENSLAASFGAPAYAILCLPGLGSEEVEVCAADLPEGAELAYAAFGSPP